MQTSAALKFTPPRRQHDITNILFLKSSQAEMGQNQILVHWSQLSFLRLSPQVTVAGATSRINQGQARGYGRITHFLPLPTWGHDFPWAIVTQPVGIFQTPGCHMKDMDIIFP